MSSRLEYGHFEFTPSPFYIYSFSGFGLRVLVNVEGQDLQLSEGFLVRLESTWTDCSSVTQDLTGEIQLHSLIIRIDCGDVCMRS